MILWSVVPAEMILANSEVLENYDEIEYNNMKCLVEKISPTQCQIVRVLTTDPEHYLCSDLQPGTILTYKPIFNIQS